MAREAIQTCSEGLHIAGLSTLHLEVLTWRRNLTQYISVSMVGIMFIYCMY